MLATRFIYGARTPLSSIILGFWMTYKSRIYIYIFDLYACLFDCLYPINVKKGVLIGQTFLL